MNGTDREEFAALSQYVDDYDGSGGGNGGSGDAFHRKPGVEYGDDDDDYDDLDEDAEYGVGVGVVRPPGPSSSRRWSPRWRFAALSAAMLAAGGLGGFAVDRMRSGNATGGDSAGAANGGDGSPSASSAAATGAIATKITDDDDDDVTDDAPSFDEEDDDVDGDVGVNGTAADAASPVLPPLKSLVRDESIVGDVSWMLNFAVVDFPKCGTTFLMNYLGKNAGAYLNKGEVCSMDRHRPHKIVKRYYDVLREHGADGKKHGGGNGGGGDGGVSDWSAIKYGLKCPEELETEYALGDYAEHFPRTDFIVSLRHPVLWFQSYYNFRAYTSYPQLMPPTDDLVGPCREGYPYVPWDCAHHCPENNFKVCTHRAKFHHALSRLGKTPMDTTEERALVNHTMTVVPTTNRIFLMENRQIILEEEASKTFPADLRDFLGLQTDLEPLKHFEKKPGKYPNEEAYAQRIDICEPEHKKAREVLVRHGAEAAEWITEYFMKSPEVVVSSPAEFAKLLEDWDKDPCDEPHRFLSDWEDWDE